MTAIPFAIVRELCESAGVDPTRVTSIRITPAAAYFQTFSPVDYGQAEVTKVRLCDHDHEEQA